VRTYIPRLYFDNNPHTHKVITYQNTYSNDETIYNGFSHWQDDSKNEFYNYVSIQEFIDQTLFTL